MDLIWKAIWKFKIPPKVRIFLWRALWDILPHEINFRSKGIEGVGLCPKYGLKEDNFHVLLECLWAQQVWKFLYGIPTGDHISSFKEGLLWS